MVTVCLQLSRIQIAVTNKIFGKSTSAEGNLWSFKMAATCFKVVIDMNIQNKEDMNK